MASATSPVSRYSRFMCLSSCAAVQQPAGSGATDAPGARFGQSRQTEQCKAKDNQAKKELLHVRLSSPQSRSHAYAKAIKTAKARIVTTTNKRSAIRLSSTQTMRARGQSLRVPAPERGPPTAAALQ